MVWYHVFFDVEGGELLRAQSFEEEWHLKKRGRFNLNQLVRSAISIAILCLFSNSLRLQHWSNLVIYFTNWSLWTILATALIGMRLASKPNYTQERALNLHAAHHLFYTLAMFTQPVVLLVYWSVVHSKNLEEIREQTSDDIAKQHALIIHSYLVHIIPGICCVCLLLVNQTVLIKRHSQYLVAFGIFYGCSNYLAVRQRGRPLYWFLTWEDHWSFVIMTTIIVVFTSLFYLTAVLDEFLTGRSASLKKKQF